MKANQIGCFDTFVLRTPLFPLNFYTKLLDDYSTDSLFKDVQIIKALSLTANQQKNKAIITQEVQSILLKNKKNKNDENYFKSEPKLQNDYLYSIIENQKMEVELKNEEITHQKELVEEKQKEIEMKKISDDDDDLY